MYNKDALNGEVIIVTGGGSGLGRAMSERFAELGAKVVIAARTEDRLVKAASEIASSTGGDVLPAVCDVRSADSCANVLKQAIDKYGKVTGLVNNAAGNFLCPSEDLSDNAFSTVVDIVLNGTWNMTQAVGKHMIERGEGGAMLNIVVAYAWTGSAFVLPSAAAKAGVLAMTRSLAVEWGSAYDIRLNAIAPGLFPTKGAWDRLVPDGGLEEQIKSHVPLRRFGEAAELAELAVYLMAPSSGYMNGECVTIDGGRQWSGGEFNEFTRMDRTAVKQMMSAMRPKKN